ncbi:MAG TPA: hypothetical protein VG106_03695, partial [Vicinamibacterales bacterium]|nr:hypothetical protein [Vicinamibacterales bacterium]
RVVTHTIARTSEEIRDVLSMLAGEYPPGRKAYFVSILFAFASALATPLLIWSLIEGDPFEGYWWESLASAIMTPLLAYEILRIGTSRYIVDDSHVAAVTPIRLGSWTVMRAELESIDVFINPTGMSLRFKSGLQSAKTMPLRKRHRDRLLRMYPELRRAKLKASAEQRAKEARSKLYLTLIFVVFVLVICMFVVIWRLP